MKRSTILSLILALLISTAARSQQPSSAYDYRVVVQPGMTIDGHRFTPDTVIGSVALNDSGQTAFIARWKDGSGNVGVYSSKRLIADEYNGLIGFDSLDFPADGNLAINAAGQVAFEAIYRQKSDPSAKWDGIFVDGELALRRSLDAVGSRFTLTDDGQIISEPLKAGAAPPRPSPLSQQGKPSLLDQLHVKPPKNLPFGITVSPKIPSTKDSNPQQEGLTAHPPVAIVAPPSALMQSNRRGQVLIPINFTAGGFIVVLGTPTNSAPQTR